MYQPHINSDRHRYVKEVALNEPIYFWMENPSECGISLSDALHSHASRLLNREQTVLEGRGPSISIWLEVRISFCLSDHMSHSRVIISGLVTVNGAIRFLQKILEPLQVPLLRQFLPKKLQNVFKGLYL